ncbi:MAG: rhodanese-like domain-containing protein [Oculatellaceae cyanobacterium bins.114]|nr:rhodanese-like domain-containing protein [Oculatellaceae cyanobacterium bins.114]
MSAYTFNQPVPQINVEAFAAHRADVQQPLQLIDVREPEELAIAQLEGFVNLPLSQFSDWSGQINTILDPTVETIVMCHHGMRSAQMCQWLINQGFTTVKNLVGGIDAYADRVDSGVPRY